MQVTRLVFTARARRARYLQTRTQAIAIEFAGDVMRGVIRSRRAGAASFQRVRSEIRDHLSQTIDAGCAGSGLLGDGYR